VLVAGISGFRSGGISPANPSAKLLRDWIDRGTFTWMVSEEILSEYKIVLRRLKVRRQTIGILINLLREEAVLLDPGSKRGISPDPGDDPFLRLRGRWRRRFYSYSQPARLPAECALREGAGSGRATSVQPESAAPRP
jgi:hypothetical protein